MSENNSAPTHEGQEMQNDAIRTTALNVLDKTITLLSAGLGFIAALAWNDAIQTLFQHIFPGAAQSVIAKFSYAAGITIIVVIATSIISKTAKKAAGYLQTGPASLGLDTRKKK